MTLLEQSEEMVARIVSFLATKGVVRSDVSALKLGYGRNNESDSLFANSINWLINEGIVHQRALHEVQGGVQHELEAKGCVLTAKGFALLAQSFDGSLTLGAAVRKRAESGTNYTNVGDLIGGLLGGFAKSLSS